MKRKILAIALSLALLSSLFVFAVPVNATPPQTVSGDWTGPRATITSMRMADGNVFMTYTSTHTLTGDIEGDMISDGWGALHPNGEWNMRSTGTFTGSFNGATAGTADYVLVLRGTAPMYSGRWILKNGTGDLAGLHAVITVIKEGPFVPNGDSYGTYTGTYHLDPQ